MQRTMFIPRLLGRVPNLSSLSPAALTVGYALTEKRSKIIYYYSLKGESQRLTNTVGTRCRIL